MLRSGKLLLYRRTSGIQHCRAFSARARPSAQPEVPPHDPTPNPEESATKPAEAALDSTADKQLTSTKGRKSSRKSKRQFTPTIPGVHSILYEFWVAFYPT